MSLERRTRLVLGWALAAGLLLRFAYAWKAYHGHYLPTSSDGYETLALSLLDRGELSFVPGHPTSMREPVFPFFIAAVYALSGRRPGVELFLHCLLSVATGLLIFVTGRRLFTERIGLAAFVVFMFYPQSIYYCGYFFRESLLCFLFAVLLWSSLDWRAEPGDPAGDRGAKIGGLASAAFGLANSAVLPACGLAGVLLWLVAPAAARRRRALWYFAPLVLAFAAWTARNWAVQGRFIAGSTHGGEEFYRALIVPADEQGTPRQVEIYHADPIFPEADKLSEADSNEFLMKAALRWIKEHPGAFVSRALNGYLKYWRLYPYRMANYQHSYALLVLVSLLSDGWIIPLGFLGLWLFRHRWREAPVFPASVFAMTFVYGTVHAVTRYRLPLMGGMMILACATAAVLFEAVKRMGWAPRFLKDSLI